MLLVYTKISFSPVLPGIPGVPSKVRVTILTSANRSCEFVVVVDISSTGRWKSVSGIQNKIWTNTHNRICSHLWVSVNISSVSVVLKVVKSVLFRSYVRLFLFHFRYLVGIVANNGFLTSEASLKVTQLMYR